MALGLFCRLYSQLLLALDDADFHSRRQQHQLGVDTARAIATCLNSLVFHTYFPEGEGQGAPAGGTARGTWNGGGGGVKLAPDTLQRGRVRAADTIILCLPWRACSDGTACRAPSRRMRP